jgi:hypothetical protein
MSANRIWLSIALNFFLVFSLTVPVRVAGASSLVLHPGGRVDTNLEMRTSIVNCGLSVSLPADADSWIDQNSSSNNLGADGSLKVQSKAGSNFRALVHFALPDVPAGCKLGSAALNLYAAAATTGRMLNVLRLNEEWSEATVTWNNQPATAGPSAAAASDFQLRRWDVTVQVQEMYNAGAPDPGRGRRWSWW